MMRILAINFFRIRLGLTEYIKQNIALMNDMKIISWYKNHSYMFKGLRRTDIRVTTNCIKLSMETEKLAYRPYHLPICIRHKQIAKYRVYIEENLIRMYKHCVFYRFVLFFYHLQNVFDVPCTVKKNKSKTVFRTRRNAVLCSLFTVF